MQTTGTQFITESSKIVAGQTLREGMQYSMMVV